MLTQDTLSNYFTIADSTNSWYETPTNTFDFVSNQSKTLVVTIGDSWTWGSDIAKHDRTHCVFGRLMAQELTADWLNLALCNQGNFWMATMAEELGALIPKLHYDKIYVVCTLTEIGRWINTKFDVYLDYITMFRDQIKTDFNKLPQLLNNEAIGRILTALDYPHVELRIGTNLVDQIGFENVAPSEILELPWYQVLGNAAPDHVYVCQFNANGLASMFEFIPKEHHSLYKQWIVDSSTRADQRLKMLDNTAMFFKRHPTVSSHQAWARYILSSL